MSKKKSTKKRIKQKLTHKYRLVILNENTLEDRFSMRLSRLNVFVFSGMFSIILITLTIYLIAFTSLKEFIPGFSSPKTSQVTHVVMKADSLRNQVRMLENYTESLQLVLRGEIKVEAIDSVVNASQDFDEKKLKPSEKDLKFREKTTSKNRFPISNENYKKTKNVFFSPITGTISDEFDSSKKHYAIDVVAKTGTAVKSIANGTVFISEWTAETGYIIAIQHVNEFISIYKHNGSLLKEQGDQVKLGEAIAEVGSTGELTTGPHLHFELWNKGFAVDPKDYINFE